MLESGRTGARCQPDHVTLSVVLPALDEEAALPGALESLRAQDCAGPLEVILADGGSRDQTVRRFTDLTRGWGDRGWTTRLVLCPESGRAVQMNAGGQLARGEMLVFLHADTWLPLGALAAIDEASRDPAVVGGGFRLKYRESGLLLRVIAGYASARSMLRGIHYGDQAMFVRRRCFEELGGFPGVPLFEDLRFSRSLRRLGRVRTLRLAVGTSARRLQAAGTVRAAVGFSWLKMRHALGADPARLKADYPDVR